MRLLDNLYALGQGPLTYSNSGFVVAGRSVEVLTGRTREQAIGFHHFICRPLRMRQVFVDPQQSLRFRCALGHTSDLRQLQDRLDSCPPRANRGCQVYA